MLFFLAGSNLNKHLTHRHFSGTIQVMKAVGNHLVLTFCEKEELFTIILTRSKAGFAIDVRTKAIRVSLSNEPKTVSSKYWFSLNTFSGYGICTRSIEPSGPSSHISARTLSTQLRRSGRSHNCVPLTGNIDASISEHLRTSLIFSIC